MKTSVFRIFWRLNSCEEAEEFLSRCGRAQGYFQVGPAPFLLREFSKEGGPWGSAGLPEIQDALDRGPRRESEGAFLLPGMQLGFGLFISSVCRGTKKISVIMTGTREQRAITYKCQAPNLLYRVSLSQWHSEALSQIHVWISCNLGKQLRTSYVQTVQGPGTQRVHTYRGSAVVLVRLKGTWESEQPFMTSVTFPPTALFQY